MSQASMPGMSSGTGCTSCHSTERLPTGGEQGVQSALSQSLRGRQEVAGHEVRVKLPGAPHRHVHRCTPNPDGKASTSFATDKRT